MLAAKYVLPAATVRELAKRGEPGMTAGGLTVTIMTFFGVTNHMGWEIFPRRWIEGCGGEILCHETAKITHHGDMAFPGDYALAPKPRA